MISKFAQLISTCRTVNKELQVYILVDHHPLNR